MAAVSKETRKEIAKLLKRQAQTSSAKESKQIADEIEKKIAEEEAK